MANASTSLGCPTVCDEGTHIGIQIIEKPWCWGIARIDGLVQDCSYSSALAMELL